MGSNPTLSATVIVDLRLPIFGLPLQTLICDPNAAFNRKSAIDNRQFFWRGAGVAELAALEMLCAGNRTVGSNPTLSAINTEVRTQRSEVSSD